MNTKNKIIAILLAGIVAMAIGVPAMGDEATQQVTVTQLGALTIVNATDLTTEVAAIDFGSGAPGDALRPPTTGTNATFALNNTYNDNMTISLNASDFIGQSHSAHITEAAEWGLLADTDVAKTNLQINDQFPMPDVDTMDPATHKYTWLKLVLPSDAIADTYSGSTLTVIATPT